MEKNQKSIELLIGEKKYKEELDVMKKLAE
jgi:hypothetical protein